MLLMSLWYRFINPAVRVVDIGLQLTMDYSLAYDYMTRNAVKLTDWYAPYLHVPNYPGRDQYGNSRPRTWPSGISLNNTLGENLPSRH